MYTEAWWSSGCHLSGSTAQSLGTGGNLSMNRDLMGLAGYVQSSSSSVVPGAD